MATFGSSITSPVISFDALGNLVGATEMAIINTSPSGVTPGTYGDASHTVQFTVTTYGDLTAAANVAIQLDASAIISGTLSALRLPSSGVTAASYGDATHVATFTVDATGRLTAAASVAITGAPPTGAAGGDLTGTYPNPTVAGLGGNALPSNVTNGFIKRNSGNTAWEEVAYGTAADTVCQGNDSRLSDSRSPSGVAGGDLTGNYPSPGVNWPTPGALGSTAANTVKCTTLVSTAGITIPNGAAGITGTDSGGITGSLLFKYSDDNIYFDQRTDNKQFVLRVGAGVATQLTLDASTLSAYGDVAVVTAGKGLRVKEGSNARMGSVALVGGTATVSNTSVTANTRIQLTSQADGGTPGWLRVSARVASTSFTITSSSGTDTSTVAWLLVEPA